MKKLSFLLMAVLVSSLVLTSCGGEEKAVTTEVKTDTVMAAPATDTVKVIDTAAGKPIVPPSNN